MPSTKSYVFIDIESDGRVQLETIEAPHATAAVRRAKMAAEGVALQLWCGATLVGAWKRIGPRSFERLPQV